MNPSNNVVGPISRSCGPQTDFADVEHVTCQRCFKISHIPQQMTADMAGGTLHVKYGGACEHCGNFLSMEVVYAR